MEIKASLGKPYTESERLDFIVEYNHNLCYEIRETEIALEAWGYTEEELIEQEQARILALSMTRSDFFDGTIKAFGAGKKELLVAIETVLAQSQMSDVEKKVAINNYENALNFYRKHPLFTILSDKPIPIGMSESGEIITITISETQWDKFFDETDKKNPDAWKELVAITVEVEDIDENADDETSPENEAGEEVINETDVNNSEATDEENSVIDEITDVEDVNNVEE